MYHVIIIGAGPAGISASLYVKRANLNVLVIYKGKSNLEQATEIDNYYGFPEGISGPKLYENGITQAQKLGVDLVEQEVVKISSIGKKFIVETSEKKYETKAIIFATGNQKIKPKIVGVKEFEGKGISYCAICDAFFYRKKNVAIIGNGQFAVSEAKELSHVANKVVILTNGLQEPKCEFEVKAKKIKWIEGDKKVSKIKFEDETEIDIDGIFIALGEAGASDFAKTLGIIQSGDNIKVNEKMETNIDGIYACGNITGGLLQVAKAVYEGAQAGLSAVEYVRRLN